jgi:hypothetical protein
LEDSPLHLSKANMEASENKSMQNTHHNESPRKVLQHLVIEKKDKNSAKAQKKSIKTCHLSQLLKLW